MNNLERARAAMCAAPSITYQRDEDERAIAAALDEAEERGRVEEREAILERAANYAGKSESAAWYDLLDWIEARGRTT